MIWKNRNPVWNEVRVNDTAIRVGQPWEEMKESLEAIGLESEAIPFGFVPRKDGISLGLDIGPTISRKKDLVSAIYVDVEKNGTDCVIELAGIRVDMGTYAEIRQAAGPETRKTEREEKTIYTWIKGDRKLILRTDKEGKILDFDLYFDRDIYEN